jgi:hypothetical protein
MNQSDVSTVAGKPPGRPKSLWRIPTIAAAATAGLAVLSIVLDAGDERARDLALLVVALAVEIRRRRTGPGTTAGSGSPRFR